MKKKLKRMTCYKHLPRPGFRHGDTAASCNRKAGHKGEHKTKYGIFWDEKSAVVHN